MATGKRLGGDGVRISVHMSSVKKARQRSRESGHTGVRDSRERLICCCT